MGDSEHGAHLPPALVAKDRHGMGLWSLAVVDRGPCGDVSYSAGSRRVVGMERSSTTTAFSTEELATRKHFGTRPTYRTHRCASRLHPLVGCRDSGLSTC